MTTAYYRTKAGHEATSRDRHTGRAPETSFANAGEILLGYSGLRLPTDETGDCHIFTNKLAAGHVAFRHGTIIREIVTDSRCATGAQTDKGIVEVDAVVVAVGSYSLSLVRPLGINAPIYPIKGYSLTIPIWDEAGAPVSTVTDKTHKVAIKRLDNRIWVGGTAKIAGYDLRLNGDAQGRAGFLLHRLFGRWRFGERSKLLVRLAPHHSRRHADCWANSCRPSLSQHRVRHVGLGLRVRPSAGPPYLRSQIDVRELGIDRYGP